MKQIKENIKHLCDSGEYGLDYEKLDIKTTISCERKPYLGNVFKVYYTVMVSDGDACVYIESCCDSKIIAYYAVTKLIELKNQKQESETTQTKKSFFERLFK